VTSVTRSTSSPSPEGHLALPTQVRGEVDGKPESVVQLEGNRTREDRFARLPDPRELLLHHPESRVERFEKTLFLVQGNRVDVGGAPFQLGVGGRELPDDGGRHLMQKRSVESQLLPVAQGPPHDPAQDVSPPLVGGEDAVGDQERGCAGVVGDHPGGGILRRRFSVLHAAQTLDIRDDPPKQVGVIIARYSLDRGRQPLQPHPRVDARLRKGDPRTVFLLVVLHEHEVPDFEEPVAIAPHGTRGASAPRPLPLVVEDLGARPARSRGSHRPEVVLLVEPDDAGGRQAHRLVPDVVRLVVLPEHRNGHPLAVDPHLARQKVPSEEYRVLLEVVPEGEIPQHLEERVMARRVAHVLQVVVLSAYAETPLRRGSPLPVGCRQSQEIFLELHHAGIGEQQARVIPRNKGGTGRHLVPMFLEIGKKCRANLCPGHLPSPFSFFAVPRQLPDRQPADLRGKPPSGKEPERLCGPLATFRDPVAEFLPERGRRGSQFLSRPEGRAHRPVDQVPGKPPQAERPGNPARPLPADVPVRPGQICAEGLVIHQAKFPEPGENVCGLRFREPLRLQPKPDLPFTQCTAGKHAEGCGQRAPRRGRLPLTPSWAPHPCQNPPM
jgi:hypothetical protein